MVVGVLLLLMLVRSEQRTGGGRSEGVCGEHGGPSGSGTGGARRGAARHIPEQGVANCRTIGSVT